MDLYDALTGLGFVFIRETPHYGQKTVHPVAHPMDRTQFVRSAGQEVIIGMADVANPNRIFHVGTLQQHAGVAEAKVLFPGGELSRTLERFGVKIVGRIERDQIFNELPCSYLKPLD